MGFRSQVNLLLPDPSQPDTCAHGREREHADSEHYKPRGLAPGLRLFIHESLLRTEIPAKVLLFLGSAIVRGDRIPVDDFEPFLDVFGTEVAVL